MKELGTSEQLIEQLPDAVFVVNSEGQILFVNVQAELLFGWARPELIGKPIEMLVPPAARAAHPVHRGSYVKDARVRPMGAGIELSGCRKDGSHFPAEISLSAIDAEGGRVVIAVVRDATARMKTQAKFQGLLEAAPDAMLGVDGDGLIRFVNTQAEKLFGWGRDELLGRPIETLVPDRVRGAHIGHRHGYFAEPQVRAMGAGTDLSARRKDGTEFPAEISLSSIETEDGVLVTAAVRDVTERKAFEGEVPRARDVAEQAARSRQEFLANMSHEIRTPMNAIIGMTSLLLDTVLGNQQRDYVETVRGSGEHLLAIINDILDYAKIDAGKFLLEELPFDARDWMMATLDLIAVQANGKDLALVHEVAPEVPAVLLGDPARLRQIVLNLLSNAVKFTHAGEVSVRMGVLRLDDDDWLSIVVRDSGIGIGADRINLLFEPFTQADPTTTRLYGGTGLGLAISRRLAEEMGGTLVLESAAGQGTQAQLLVPVGRREAVLPTTPEGLAGTTLEGLPTLANSAFEMPAQARRLAILIVEDTPVNQKVAQHLLARFGFRSEVVASGYEALSALTQRSYDLVLMDVQMPQLDGLEATRQIRRKWPQRQQRIIAMTANVAPEDVRRCYEAGMDGFLAKPIVVESLAAVLRDLLVEAPPGLNSTLVLVDPAVVGGLCEQLGRGTVREIADMFIADIAEAVPALQDGCRDQDRQRIAATAHRLKGSARSLGADPFGDLLNRLEKQAPTADWPTLTRLVGQVSDQHLGVHDQLQAELAR